MNTKLIIFGATGDLMSRKIAPSLYHLYGKGQLPDDFSIIGFGRRDFSHADFRQFLQEGFCKQTHVKNSLGIMPPRMEKFLELFTYHQGNFDQAADFQRLAKELSAEPSNKLFYLAVPPSHYETIFKNLAAAGLAAEQNGIWSRILVEKPFGNNLAQAEKLDALLNSLFGEDQVYRIDHYLAKEILQNIVAFRFANNLLEDVWNNKFIESIDIKLLEKIDIEGRGKFYEDVGALLDVGQNHLLQMLALIAMDRPTQTSGDAIRSKRAEILGKTKILSAENIATHTIRGQYDGYLKEKDVAPDSTIETYFKIETEIETDRWRGVPVTLESGKKFPEVQKEIVVTFRHPSPCFCPPGKHYKNRIIFRIQPNAGITIEFWSKKPGKKMELEQQLLSFQYEAGRETRYLEEYAQLFSDAMAGDQTLFVSGEETMAGWRFIDPIVHGWRENLLPLIIYKNKSILAQQFSKPKAETINHAKTFGILGLGRMGAGLAQRMLDQGWEVLGWNRTLETATKLKDVGLQAYEMVDDLIAHLLKPKIIWLMLPAGKVVDEAIENLTRLLTKGDFIIDGGNSFYKDSIRRHKKLKELGINFLDVGVSGGPWGARHRPCLMIGGEKESYEQIKDLFADMAVDGSLQFFEGAGAGHFVKMVHNGIEYGMMQALAEGFDILKNSNYDLDLLRVADIYNRGSVIESRLVGWLADAYKKYGFDLQSISGEVTHTGEGQWTVAAAQELNLQSAVLSAAFDFRINSKDNPSYAGKIVSALRGEFGQHHVTEEK
jgi:glucose-6-phosphate 1-dehydrogenase